MNDVYVIFYYRLFCFWYAECTYLKEKRTEAHIIGGRDVIGIENQKMTSSILLAVIILTRRRY